MFVTEIVTAQPDDAIHESGTHTRMSPGRWVSQFVYAWDHSWMATLPHETA
ncbi:MAG: hypothetical protein Kow0063_32930 [Anaerolineae bacterium]